MAGRVAGLLLAAGQGRRFGYPKALAPFGPPGPGDARRAPAGRPPAGRHWVESALASLRDGGCDPVAVVLGAGADQVQAVAELGGAVVVEHADWSEGIGSSLRAGLSALTAIAGPGPPSPVSGSVADRRDLDAAVVLLVDTPGIGAEVVTRLMRLAGPEVLAVATYHGRPGHPVVLGRAHWSGVASLAVGDSGAREYLRQRPELVRRIPCEDIADGTDIDHCR